VEPRAFPLAHAAEGGPLLPPANVRGKVIDEGLWKYCLMTAAQPGALHAPLAFLSAALFSADINRLYESLTPPVWMVHGDRGDFVDYRRESTVAGRPGWSFRTMQTGALP
jgi:hypothetical protein